MQHIYIYIHINICVCLPLAQDIFLIHIIDRDNEIYSTLGAMDRWTDR